MTESYEFPKPPPGIVDGIARHLGFTVDEAYALLTDPARAPGIMATVQDRFNLTDDYDDDGPVGLQLWQCGWLTEIEAQWLDGVVDEHE